MDAVTGFAAVGDLAAAGAALLAGSMRDDWYELRCFLRLQRSFWMAVLGVVGSILVFYAEMVFDFRVFGGRGLCLFVVLAALWQSVVVGQMGLGRASALA